MRRNGGRLSLSIVEVKVNLMRLENGKLTMK